jgi:hypothetical protein
LQLRPGTLRYALRCAGDRRGSKPRASGSLVIKRDSGDVPVSRRPPVNALDADGRRYTVLFQTRPPALTLGWSAAPSGATGLSLHVESPRVTQTFPAPTASQRLASGTLAEGSYTWWYTTAADARRRGRPSPSGSTTQRRRRKFFPRRSDGEKAPGLIAVDGVTIDGTKVSVGGQSVAVDERGRFRATVAPLDGDDAVAVRLEHPRTGIHYYVRRPAARHHGRARGCALNGSDPQRCSRC